MSISYEKTKNKYNKYANLDLTKKNILILGPGKTDNERKNIINPMSLVIVYELFGDSDLYHAYKEAYDIAKSNNIYICNCFTTSDYLELSDKIVQYDFDYVVITGLLFSDKFYNPYIQSEEYYINYFINSLQEANSLSTLIVTDKHASLYEDIDSYLKDMKTKQNQYLASYNSKKILNKYGGSLVFVLNMLDEIKYANCILGGMLLANESYLYPSNIKQKPYFHIDKNDIKNENYVYFKYSDLTKSTSVENLVNFKTTNDIYKNILINEIIKRVLKILDLNEYKGKLYNNYTKLQISTKVNSLLKPYTNKLFKDHKIEKVGFIKTQPGCGYIYIELSIVPFGLIEKINLVMEV